jgi:phage shock protein PspC (stress-responsive transcriptional regulator)
MNKTLTINISGIIFHIEEDAYNKLGSYLNAIKNYFAGTEGGAEILSDIEARIAEFLQGKTGPAKQVILMPDVQNVIETLGQPEQFAEHEPETNEFAGRQQQSTTEPVKKRLFRDPDNKAIGGVCSGIAAYFDVDIVWVRLATFLLIFFGGMSLWIYLILWFVIPQAKTTSEKLAMKGEKIDINNISKTVKEEADQLKKRMQKYGDEILDKQSHLRKSSGNFFDKLGDFLKEILSIFGKIVVALIGLFLLILGLTLMFALFSTIFGVSLMGANSEYANWVNIFFHSKSVYNMSLLGLSLFVGVPTMLLIYAGIKMLFKIQHSNRWFSISAALLWMTGLIILFFSGARTANQYKEKSLVKNSMAIIQSDTIHLSLNNHPEFLAHLTTEEEDEDEFFAKSGSLKIHLNKRSYVFGKKEDSLFFTGYAKLNIVQASGENYELQIIKKARGEDKITAVQNAKAIVYNANQSKNKILFDEYFTMATDEKFHFQQVQLILRVPINKIIYIDRSISQLLDDVENTSGTLDEHMAGRRWKMTDRGLQCIDCEGIGTEEKKELSIHL